MRAADSSAASLRSVLKMLNSVSSAVKAAPVSSSLSAPVEPSTARSLPSPMVRPLMTLESASRSSVKSCSTLRSLENVMMAIRSEGVIWVLRNFWAAVWARIWS